MEDWRKNFRKDIVMVDVDALVPKDHLLRKIEDVMDYEWLYARLSPYYCADNGRSRSRSGRVNKNGVASASVWDSVSASDSPGNSSKYNALYVLTLCKA